MPIARRAGSWLLPFMILGCGGGSGGGGSGGNGGDGDAGLGPDGGGGGAGGTGGSGSSDAAREATGGGPSDGPTTETDVGGAGDADLDRAIGTDGAAEITPPDSGGSGGADGSDSGGGGGDGPAPAAGDPFVYVGSPGETRIFRLDMATGMLAPRGMSEGSGYMAADPTRRYVYGIARPNMMTRINAFRMNPANGALTKINDAVIPNVDGPTHVWVHPSAGWLFAAHYQSGHASVLPLMPDGGVGAPSDVKMAGTNAHFIMSDPSGKFVLVPCLEGFVAQYTFNSGTGKLAANSPATAAVASARHMDLHPSQRFAYVIGEGNSRMTSMLYDAATGKLSQPMGLSTLPNGGGNNSGAHVAVHPSGKFVYGSNRGHDSIVIFSVNETTGRLTLVGHETDGGLNTPWDFAIDTTGKYMVVINAGSGAAISYAINPSNGTLTRKDTAMTPMGRPAHARVFYPPS